MIHGTHSDNDPQLDLEIALANFRTLWQNPNSYDSIKNEELFKEESFVKLQNDLLIVLSSNKLFVTSSNIINLMWIAIFACETYQDHSLLHFIVEEFSTYYPLIIISHLKSIHYLPFLKRIFQLDPEAGDSIIYKILTEIHFSKLLEHRVFVELLSTLNFMYTDYIDNIATRFNTPMTAQGPRLLLEIAVKLADFDKVDMLLYILRNEIAVRHIASQPDLYSNFYLIKAVLKCAEYDVDLAINLLSNPDIPIDLIRKPGIDFQKAQYYEGPGLFFLVAHFWVNNKDVHFKRKLKASIIIRTSDAIDIEEEIARLDCNADEIAFSTTNIHNFPLDFIRSNPQLRDIFQRFMDAPLLVINFGEKNPSLVDFIQKEADLTKVVCSALRQGRLHFVFNLLNKGRVSLASHNPLHDVIATSMGVDNLVYLALLTGNPFNHSLSVDHFQLYGQKLKFAQAKTKYSRVRARLNFDRRSFVAAAMACGDASPDIQMKTLTFAYPCVPRAYLQSAPAIVSRWKDPKMRAELRLQILEKKLNKQLKIK